MKPCKHCRCTNEYIGIPIYNEPTFTGGPPAVEFPVYPCKYCEGKGWIAGLIKHKYSNYDNTAKEELEEKTKKLLTI